MTELKCLSGDEPRIEATQEFIDKHKLKLRTQEEILEKYKEYEDDGRMFDFRPEVLLEHLSYENSSQFLSDEYKAKVSSGEIKHTCVDNVIEATQDFLDYMQFAWRKAQDERVLSASRSIQKLSAWLWLLNREDLESKIQEDGLYNPYGAPALVEVCKALEINVPESLIEFSKQKKSSMKFLLKKVEDHYYLLSNEKICGKGYRMDMVRSSIGVIDDQEYYNKYPNDFKLIIASTNNLERVALIDIINLSKSFKLDQEGEISTQRTEWVAYVEMVNSPTHIDRYGDLRYNKYEPKVTDGFINILRIVDYETN